MILTRRLPFVVVCMGAGCKQSRELVAREFEAAYEEARAMGWTPHARGGGRRKAEWRCPACVPTGDVKSKGPSIGWGRP